jgi:hypothetical protein
MVDVLKELQSTVVRRKLQSFIRVEIPRSTRSYWSVSDAPASNVNEVMTHNLLRVLGDMPNYVALEASTLDPLEFVFVMICV